jgi:ketosteroid isomerase-like protein
MTDTATTPADLTEDEAAIWELHRGFLHANRVAEWAFLEENMAPGDDHLIWYNLNQSNYIGVDHIVELWKMLAGVSQGREALVEPRDERVEVIGDVAVVSCLLHFEADFGNLGKVIQDARNTEVWQRIDGKWKMFHFHCSNYTPGVMGGK